MTSVSSATRPFGEQPFDAFSFKRYGSRYNRKVTQQKLSTYMTGDDHLSNLATMQKSNQSDLSLDHLATRIQDSHRMCESSIRAGLGHAIKCGQALIEAKSQLAHGAWLNWLAAKFDGLSERQAQGYMRIARNLPALESKAKPVSLLGVREALELLAEPKNDESTVNWLTGPLPDAGHRLVGRLQDGRAIQLTAAEDPKYVHIAVFDLDEGTMDHTTRCVTRIAVHTVVAFMLGAGDGQYDSDAIAWNDQEPCAVWPGTYHAGHVPDWKPPEQAGRERAEADWAE